MWSVHEQTCATVEPVRCGDCLHRTFPHWVTAAAGPAQAAALHERALATLARVARLVVPSARAIPPFAALGVPAARFTVVANGVDTEALQALPPPACGPGPLRLCYLGTLMPSKGLHVLIDAVQRLPRGTVRLAVHGNAVSYHGDDAFLLRCFQRLRPGDDCHYHGPYATAELPAILQGADVVCAPALWHEAFGLTVREALAAARPVLVSRVGGLQDAVADGVEGRVLPPGERDAWARAIAELAADRAAVRAMAARARGRARGFLAMADDLLRVYGEARATGPAAGA
jgi:glycosyltransferase involved in cell wall biosynthesis